MTRTRVPLIILVGLLIVALCPALAYVSPDQPNVGSSNQDNPEGWLNPPFKYPGPFAMRHPSYDPDAPYPLPTPEPPPSQSMGRSSHAGLTSEGLNSLTVGISGSGNGSVATSAPVEALEITLRDMRRALDG